MKNLSLGIQTLSEIRSRNCIYVDKTENIHHLVTKGKAYFFKTKAFWKIFIGRSF